MVATQAQAYATPAVSPSSQAIPVAGPDTSLPAAFAWLTEAVSSSPIAESDTDPSPVPDAAPALRRFQAVLDRLGPQSDEGDLAGLSEEIADFSELRVRATRPLIDD
jgi:hypothetical protein